MQVHVTTGLLARHSRTGVDTSRRRQQIAYTVASGVVCCAWSKCARHLQRVHHILWTHSWWVYGLVQRNRSDAVAQSAQAQGPWTCSSSK